MKGGLCIYCKFRLKGYAVVGILLVAVSIVFSILTSGYNHEYVATTADTNQEKDGINVPIIMYHGILNDKKLQGEYVISPQQFEDDLKNLKAMGYTTIVMKDLINYVYNDVALPEKPIILTFDDGYYNNYVYAYPLLKQYQCKMVLSPIGYYADRYTDTPDVSPTYGHCTWSNLQEMVDSGTVELQNHSYNMHSNKGGRIGIKKKTAEKVTTYEKLIADDITQAQNRFKENLKLIPDTFTYPFGAVCDEAQSVVKELGFKASLICQEKSNTITKDKECLYNLGRYLRSSKDNGKAFLQKLEKS